jgi:hypothetical protein
VSQALLGQLNPMFYAEVGLWTTYSLCLVVSVLGQLFVIRYLYVFNNKKRESVETPQPPPPPPPKKKGFAKMPCNEVMLKVHLVSILNPYKNDVAIKITIGLMIDHY